MSKKLSDFTVRINLDGWYIKGFRTVRQGDEFQGKMIHPRMIQAIKNDEKFILNGDTRMEICVLRGGSIEEFEELLSSETEEVIVHKAVKEEPIKKEFIKKELVEEAPVKKEVPKVALDEDEPIAPKRKPLKKSIH